MLEGTFVSREFGTSDRDAFMWDMSVLYEHALRGVITHWPDGNLNTSRGRARILNAEDTRVSSSKVKPDYVLDTASATLVLDAKYKETRTSDPDDETTDVAIGTSKIRLTRSDIYQAVSYGQHEHHLPAVVGLVYPVVLGAGEPLPYPYRIKGFTEDVLVLFLDVGAAARDNILSFSISDFAPPRASRKRASRRDRRESHNFCHANEGFASTDREQTASGRHEAPPSGPRVPGSHCFRRDRSRRHRVRRTRLHDPFQPPPRASPVNLSTDGPSGVCRMANV